MEIKENIYYVGVLDEGLKTFDVIMNTKYGSSYNSYLVKGKNKTALIETVKNEFADEFIKNIEKYTDIKDIDYLIVNHTEPDHAGSIGRLLEINPNIEVCGTKMAIDFVRNIINFDFKSNVLSANDSIDLGGKEFKFFAFPMLHWPDSMYTYLREDNMLFTCDSFGVHYASKVLYNDLEEKGEVLEDKTIVEQYKYYFDNILGPFKTPFLLNALNKISLIPIDYICPGHGMIIRKDIPKYIEMYKSWCTQTEDVKPKITICYVSSYGYTKRIARALMDGIKSAEVDVELKVYDLQVDSMEEAKKDVASSQGILLGSPTILSDSLPQIYDVMSVLNPIINKGMYAISFGSFAWSGEASVNINNRFEALKFNIPHEPIRIKLNPSEYDIEQIEQIGKEFAKTIVTK